MAARYDTIGAMHGCLDCDRLLTKSLVDYPYHYDHGAPIQLRSITRLSCTCGYYEIEIPKMGPLHETIAQALSVLHVKRDALVFFFKKGRWPIKDGHWNVIVSTLS
jgi:hypothetical protein